jgi:hypothetical protein
MIQTEGQNYPLPALLAAVDNALRNGSYMNNANLAFEYLCDHLGVDRDSLIFDLEWSRRPAEGGPEKCPVCYTTTAEHKGWCAIGQSAVGGPEGEGARTWDLPPPPGPEVTAVLDCSDRRWERVDRGWQLCRERGLQPIETWWALFRANAPLTEAPAAPAALDGGQPDTPTEPS